MSTEAVTMYTTSSCPYCVRAKALLRNRGVVEIKEINIETSPTLQTEMVNLSGGRRTVPQIFINNTHVGGCDDLMALDRQGALLPLLQSGQKN